MYFISIGTLRFFSGAGARSAGGARLSKYLSPPKICGNNDSCRGGMWTCSRTSVVDCSGGEAKNVALRSSAGDLLATPCPSG